MPGPATYDPLRDGYATLIVMSLTTPNPVQGGGPIESTHMRRTVWRMKDPKTLKTLGNLTGTVMYATDAYPDIIAVINEPQAIQLQWPDGALLDFFGWLDDFTPSGHSEGNLPTANYVIIPTLYDPEDGTEVAPTFTPGGP